MKYLRRTLYSFGVLILALVLSGFIITFFYSDSVKRFVVQALNKELNTEVNVKDIHFSLIKDFPMASLQFIGVEAKDASIDAQKRKGLLFKAESIFLSFSVKDLWDKKYAVKKLKIYDGKVRLIVNEDGTDNYHFWKKDSASNENFQFALNKVVIRNVEFLYDNRLHKQKYNLQLIESVVSGKFNKIQSRMNTETQFQVLEMKTDSMSVLKGRKGSISAELTFLENYQKIQIVNGGITVEEFRLLTNGTIDLGTSGSKVDLSFKGDNLDISESLSLLPGEAFNKLRSYESSGKVNFSSRLWGAMSKTEMPAFRIDFGIENGEIKPEASPERLKGITLKGTFLNERASPEKVSALDIEHFSMALNNRKINGSLTIKDFKDPLLRLNILGSVDLDFLSRMIKVDTLENFGGMVDFKVNMSGRLNSMNKKTFAEKKFKASGEVELHNVSCDVIKTEIKIRNVGGRCILEDNNLVVSEFTGLIGKSDFILEGSLQNCVTYLFSENGRLIVEGKVISRSLDLEEVLLPFGKSDKDSSLSDFKPVQYNLDLEVGNLKYKKFSADNIKGLLSFKDGFLEANKLSFSAMEGLVKIDGVMDARRRDSILISGRANIRQLNVNQLFYQTGNFGQEVVQDKNIRGFVTADIEMASVWSGKFKINTNKLFVRSSVKIENGELHDFQPLLALSKFVKLNELKKVRFSTLQNEIVIKDRKIIIPSMQIESNALNLKVAGTHDFDNVIDYRLTLLLSELLGRKVKEQSDFGKIEDDGLGKTRLFITMKGKISDPKFAYDRGAVKEKLKTDLAEEKKNLKNIMKDEFGSWFKRDTVSAKKNRENLNTPKNSISIDKDEEETEKHEIKPSDSKKSSFQRFKEKLKEPVEDQ